MQHSKVLLQLANLNMRDINLSEICLKTGCSQWVIKQHTFIHVHRPRIQIPSPRLITKSDLSKKLLSVKCHPRADEEIFI